jgi:hypothetical protein
MQAKVALDLNPAQEEAMNRLLKMFAVSSLLGGTLRVGASMLSPGGVLAPTTDVIAAPKKVVIPIPIKNKDKDKEVTAKYAVGPGTGVDLNFPEGGWLDRNFPAAARAWNENVPEYKGIGGSGAQQPDEVPWLAGLVPMTVLGGLTAGAYGTDRLIDQYQKWQAERLLEKAQNAYHKQIVHSYRDIADQEEGEEEDNKKQAADVSPCAQLERTLTAIYRHATTKQAAPTQGNTPGADRSPLARFLFPLGHMGEYGAAANAGLIAMLAAAAGYGGYEYTRDQSLAELHKKQFDAIEMAQSEERAPVVVGKFVDAAAHKKKKPSLALKDRLFATEAA